ncbi:alpha/beta hydrolase [Paludibaculum fermentans]|uniref:Alpha/beta fold hydrolase n=1 Tax=Paludibaculum fermentans TaxID=1473598 RepID=A0A7S7NSN3_PALFE|nr:alpha/beta hydrolase [Paludibaculum fermentans]QOY88995.1 alpha/beta fold hydrolase [Paludibaculum fermentans]
MKLRLTLVLAGLVSSLIPALAADPAQKQSIAQREFFYIGGRYRGAGAGEVMTGQMYVEVLRPVKIRRRYPLVLIHGAGQTATNWMGTPDGRAGWADYFLSEGYVVYMVDQPARGRSAWHSSTNPMLTAMSPAMVAQRFTAPEVNGNWPQAKKHTQWPGSGPGKGQKGDPIFDAFYATQVEYVASNAETEPMMQAASTALLDRIGPAVILTHSQAGLFGWPLADARPKLVKGIVAVEPSGPPFEDVLTGVDGKARAWGLTDFPLTYDPPATGASDLKVVRDAGPDGPGLATCWKQADPPRQLPNLKDIPVLIVTSEASYHAAYDHCTARYLSQAGVRNTHLRLTDVGIRGNGHMMMLEKNSAEIAAKLHQWIAANVK